MLVDYNAEFGMTVLGPIQELPTPKFGLAEHFIKSSWGDLWMVSKV